MVALIFYMSLGQREMSMQTAKSETSHIVKHIKLTEEEFMSKTELFLFVLSKLDILKDNNQQEKCSEFLSKLLEQLEFYSNIAVSDLQGNIYCSAIPLENPVNVSDRKYFINVISNRRFSLGDYQIGRIVKKPVWVAGHPILTDDGVLQGVVGVSIDLKWLNKLLSDQPLPPQSILKVFDGHGVILVSYPNSSEVGQKKNLDREIAYVLQNKKSPFELKGSDGKLRVYTYSKFDPTSTNEEKYVIIGLDKSFIERPADETFKKSLVLALIIVLAVFVIVFINWQLFIYPQSKT